MGPFARTCSTGLNVFPIRVPPLRERAEDIPLLVWRFVDQSRSCSASGSTHPRENLVRLQSTWPGNIRELRNAVERAMIVATGSQLTIPSLGDARRGSQRQAD